MFVELRHCVLGVHHRDDRVQQVTPGDIDIHKESLRHRRRVRQPGSFDNYTIEMNRLLLLLFSKLAQNAHQVATNGAADTAIVHLDDLVPVLQQQFIVDADFAEFVFDHRNALAMRLAQDAVEERGFATPKEACNDRNGDQGHQITL